MQNVFPARELYNSNPCREMWDSEQFSQAPLSCSQGSQNSSSDMFSQSKTSQIKGFNSFDVWSQPTNSQQISEDEPVKYYMKYMTKPPLFSSETERQSRQQKPQTATSYRELIEIQKKKTTEKDDRDVLDSFISLLKDYTKEVKTAMDSFKDSIDTTLTSNAEQVASAASESAELIKKLKDDLLEGFGNLRKDLKENGELKEVTRKQNERIVEQETQIKMLQAQLDNYRAREEKSMTEKQEKCLEREDKLLKKLDEISYWHQPGPQIPIPLNQASMVGHQAAECLLHPGERYVPQNQSVPTYQPRFVRDSTEAPTSVRLNHMQTLPQPSLHHPATEAFHLNEHAANYRQDTLSMGYQHHPQSSTFASESAPFHSLRGQDDAVVPASAVNISTQQNQHGLNHPTATIAPMRPALNQQNQKPLCQQERKLAEPVISKGEQGALPAIEVVFVPDNQPQETRLGVLTSPGPRSGILSKTSWPKHSPIVAVQPQIRFKREGDGEKTKVPGPPCAKKARKEDPLEIFVFDLTSSSEEESCDGQYKNLTSPKVAPKLSVNRYGTRSKKFQQISTKTFAESGKITTQQRKSKKSVAVTVDTSDLQNETTSTSKFKQASCIDEKTCSYNKTAGSTYTPNRPIRPSIENGIPRSKVAQNVFQFQKSKNYFKRNCAAAKRALSFDASIFDGMEDDENIQQITESIRKHAQRRKAAKVL